MNSLLAHAFETKLICQRLIKRGREDRVTITMSLPLALKVCELVIDHEIKKLVAQEVERITGKMPEKEGGPTSAIVPGHDYQPLNPELRVMDAMRKAVEIPEVTQKGPSEKAKKRLKRRWKKGAGQNS